MDWIPCIKNKPKDGQEVLLTYKNSVGTHVGEAIYSKGQYLYIADTDTEEYEEIYSQPIAWMPKPKPYKE